MKIYSKWKNPCSYLEALSLQEKKVFNIINKKSDKKSIYILAGSHFPVVTSGLRSSGIKDFTNKKKLIEKNFFFTKVKRGGSVTVHMPEQLVVYPILSLDFFNIDIKEWVNFLKESFQKLIKIKYGMHLDNKEDGLYFKNKKILFVGLRVKNRVSYHGISLNVNNNLESFNWINPCGYKNLQVTSLSRELEYCCNLKEIYTNWLEYLKDFIISKTGLSYEHIKHIKHIKN
ncbi:MAG: lipoyl(octanoyl) transferase LipB [Bdellovibrionales bacterium]|nr:lipoyl(octanoyl) transferase LipB [Bdellovibrionales bacterium]